MPLRSRCHPTSRRLLPRSRCGPSAASLCLTLACLAARPAAADTLQRLGGPGSDLAYAVAAAPDGGLRLAASLTGPLWGEPEAVAARAVRAQEREALAEEQGEAEEDEDRAPPRAPTAASAPGPVVLPPGRTAAAVVAYDARGAQRWSADVLGEGGAPAPRGVAVDAAGITYGVGWFQGRVAIPGTAAAAAAVGASDAYVLALDADGAPRWLLGVGGKLADTATQVLAADGGGCLVAGSFRASARFGSEDGGAPRLRTSRGGIDTFLLRLDADGRVLWLRTFGGAGDDEPVALARAPDGGAYLLLRHSGELDLDLPDAPRHIALRGGEDALLLRLGADGMPRAASAIGSARPDSVAALASDGRGVVVLGALAGERELHVDEATLALRSRGASDALLLRFDADLRLLDHAQFGGDGALNLVAAAYADDGTLWLGGSFTGRLRLAGHTLRAHGGDALLLAVDARLQPRRVAQRGGRGVQQVYALAAGGRALLAAGGFTRALLAPDAAWRAHGRSDAFLWRRASAGAAP